MGTNEKLWQLAMVPVRHESGRIKRQTACLSIVLIAITATVAAQDKPDFSGRWVLVDSAPSDPGAALSLTIRQPITRTNVFGAPIPPAFLHLTVEREFVDHARTENLLIGVEGGSVGGVPGQTALRTHVSVRWEGNRLVIETGSYSGSTREAGPYTERIEAWELDAAGTLVVSITDRGSDMDSRSNTSRYHRGAEPQVEPARMAPCTGVTVALSADTPRVKIGERPRFSATIRNGTSQTVRLLDLREGRRPDLQATYLELFVARGVTAVEVPIVISDPGPLADGDFIDLPPGAAMNVRDVSYKRVLNERPAGEYDAFVLFWRDPLAAPTTRCRSSSSRFVVAR